MLVSSVFMWVCLYLLRSCIAQAPINLGDNHFPPLDIVDRILRKIYSIFHLQMLIFFLGNELRIHVVSAAELRRFVSSSQFLSIHSISCIIFRFWEIAIPVMVIVVPIFMWNDILQGAHYMKKRWVDRKIRKVSKLAERSRTY